eukprot:m.97622 g.97622  ORF g.97622 m.97622 type:complete len:1296 (+) comp26995_c0_seq1:59-3946(+)
MAAPRNTLEFWLNGNKIVETNINPELTLLQYLRKNRLTGTKLGCGEGGCGACTVTVSSYNSFEKDVVHRSVNACLASICSMDGMSIVTVEGIGSSKTQLHPIQERIASGHGSQCGFCTPGIVMSMYSLLQNTATPTEEQVEDAFEGNLCRCTGYRPILSAFKTFCGGDGVQPTKHTQTSPTVNEIKEAYDRNAKTEFIVQGERSVWTRPCSLDRLLELKLQYPQAKLVGGFTELGVESKFRGIQHFSMISPIMIPEMSGIVVHDNHIQVGAAISLTDLQHGLQNICKEQPEYRCWNFTACLEMLRWFAGEQIRNMATLAGNIVNASPISDLAPVFLAARTTLTVVSPTRTRVIKITDFHKGYRKTDLAVDEVVVSFSIPFTKQHEYTVAFKQSRRREDDIALANGCFRVVLTPNNEDGGDNAASFKVDNMFISVGGMAATTISAPKTESIMKGQVWSQLLMEYATTSLREELSLPTSVPGGMPEYRMALCCGFLFKFFLLVSSKQADVDPRERSALDTRHRPVSKSRQVWDAAHEKEGPVGKPMVHVAATKQSCGEAIYVDDMPRQEGELQSALVLSRCAHGNIVSIDATAALAMVGVKGFYTSKDVPGHNETGPIFKDEEVFAAKKVTCMGQPIGIIVAETREQAREAAMHVVVEYEDLDVIVTIEDAIKANSYYRSNQQIKKGNLEQGFAQSDHIIEGEQRMGGQEHFYLETNGTLAVPKGEDGEMEIFASTQNPRETQMNVAEALGVAANKIVCRVKRLGGGFGGKESRSVFVSLAAAVAAHHTGRAVRCILERDEDMLATGGRHPFLAKYKVGFTKDGRVLALDIQMYSNAGNSTDLSNAVMDRALFHMDNVYKIPNIRGSGFTCKTNLCSNTAFRGFGGPQGLFFAELWITDVAHTCSISQTHARELNFYNEGDLTHFNQALDKCQIQNVWTRLKESSDYDTKFSEVQDYNKNNRWTKRGLAMIPTKFGIAFTATFMNQAGAFINIYTDGSVLLTHGGTEMGQGLHTKMIQVCARALDIPVDVIHITETSTNTVPNTSPTAASASSDLNGMAVVVACNTINERLKPLRAANPGATWKELVNSAYFGQISLSATGFYKTPDLGYDFDTNTGRPFNYFNFGAACAVVEIDVLSGDHQVISTDIVMDVGHSLNPAIDIGQVEGAFVQGYGLFTMEEMVYSATGNTFTRGPGTYKLPGFKDIPIDFSVSLLREAPNDRAVYSSKAVGEPPLFLGSSVFFAIKDAIRAARLEFGVQEPIFRLDSPATCERIRMACADNIARTLSHQEGERWNVQA